jgi:hypothetical protein
MKNRSLISLVGFAMSFALPILGQQKETLDAQAVEKADPLAGQYDKTCNSNDAAAVAALFTDDAVFITPDGQSLVGKRSRNSIQNGSREGVLATIRLLTIPILFRLQVQRIR